MSISRVKDAQGRTRYEFEFSKRIKGQRVRVRKLLPGGWDRAKADAYDRTESGKLYAISTGVDQKGASIEDAVACFIRGRAVELKNRSGVISEIDMLAHLFAGKNLADLPEVCAAYTAESRTILAPATIKNRLRYLVAACRYAWKHHKMGDRDPGAGVVFPAVSNKRHTYIDRGLMLAIAWSCEDRPTRAAIRIAFYSGMRLGEIERAERGDGVFILHDTKNGEPRKVPMHPKVKPYAHIELGTRFHTGYHWRKARALMGMEDVRFHDLRHSAASAMIDEGVDLFTIGAVLGHKSQASTGRYAHLAQHKLREAVGQIGRRA